MCICALIRMEIITNQIYAAYAPKPKQSSSEAEVQMGNFSTISETEICTHLFTTYSAAELPNLHLLISEADEQK